MELTAANRDLAARALKDVKTARRAFARWHAAVDAHLAGDATALDGKRPPAKARKHQMYANASRVIMILGWNYDERPHDLAGIDDLVARAELALAA